jgi:hypothetical protein
MHMQRFRFPRPHAALLAAALLLAGAVLVYAHGSGPRTDDVTASFELTRQSAKARQCVGQDGRYVETLDFWTGTSTSNDPRLNGALFLFSRMLLKDNPPPDRDGTMIGRWIIHSRDEAGEPTGDRLEGVFTAVIEHSSGGFVPFPGPGSVGPSDFMKGFITGPLKDRRGNVQGVLFANFTSGLFDADDRTPDGYEAAGGELGGDHLLQAVVPSHEDPAVIQSGACSGEFRQVETPGP